MIRALAAFCALGLLAAPAVAAPPPKLSFTVDEVAFADAVADDPGLAAFYGSAGLQPAFTGPQARPRRAALLAAVRAAPEHGLPAQRYRPERLEALLDTASTRSDELEIARLFSAWVHDVSAGIVDPRRVDPGIKRVAQGADTGRLLRDFAAAGDPGAVLARAVPSDPRYRVLQDALARARGIEVPPGTPVVPDGVWREGMRDPGVAALRARLAAIGFAAEGVDGTDDPALFDADLARQVARFQQAAGIGADGIAGPMTVGRMNAAGGPGPRDLLMAMERLRWLPDDLSEGGRRYVWVNLPQYMAAVVEDGHTIFDTKVVIGKTASEMNTPEFSDRLRHIVANPSWNVPRSITVKEYLPKLKANRNAVGHLDIIDGSGRVVPRAGIDFSRYTAANFPYRMREKPSPGNALGQVKFLFPNPWNIYLHDTPTKWLFNQAQRAASHGCVRVGRPLDLARLLLEGQVNDPAATLDAALKGGNERWLTLKAPIPIHLVYFTTLPDEAGIIRHYPDIYGRDAELWAALGAAFAPSAQPRRMAGR